MIRIPDDDVIEHFDLQELAGANDVPGEFDVRLRGIRFPARMVVLCDAPVYVMRGHQWVADMR
jgi:hypothetical protein